MVCNPTLCTLLYFISVAHFKTSCHFAQTKCIKSLKILDTRIHLWPPAVNAMRRYRHSERGSGVIVTTPWCQRY
jgi:hypothetical protein